MDRISRYDMIEGYLDGTLTPGAAHELELMVASDPELAAELRAEELIRDTLANDVAALPVVATEPSGLLLTKLAATSGSTGAFATGGGVFATVFGTTTGLSLLTLFALLGLVVGALFFAESEKGGVVGAGALPADQHSPFSLPNDEREKTTLLGKDQSGIGINSAESIEDAGDRGTNKGISSSRRRNRGGHPTSSVARERETGKGSVGANGSGVTNSADVAKAQSVRATDTTGTKGEQSSNEVGVESMVERLQKEEQNTANDEAEIPVVDGSKPEVSIEVDQK